MQKILCFLGFHDWVHVCEGGGKITNTDKDGNVTSYRQPANYYKECKHCKTTAPDPEQERFGNFCNSSRDAGLTTEEMRSIVRSGKY